ncbi:hypothetical protein DPEC_G00010560 [Dallia pectoralis]|uniref:Uncharacterized protein n=1 Tax=Dallia pectoralis TaxID=75939 RepID=A0ACC2HM29_DALPE|nr:hypothetical protein DPEC_G00010560 [Dallia pectoralis]
MQLEAETGKPVNQLYDYICSQDKDVLSPQASVWLVVNCERNPKAFIFINDSPGHLSSHAGVAGDQRCGRLCCPLPGATSWSFPYKEASIRILLLN